MHKLGDYLISIVRPFTTIFDGSEGVCERDSAGAFVRYGRTNEIYTVTRMIDGERVTYAYAGPAAAAPAYHTHSLTIHGWHVAPYRASGFSVLGTRMWRKNFKSHAVCVHVKAPPRARSVCSVWCVHSR